MISIIFQVLVVVDGSMVAEHKDEVKYYVLNIMNMVSHRLKWRELKYFFYPLLRLTPSSETGVLETMSKWRQLK